MTPAKSNRLTLADLAATPPAEAASKFSADELAVMAEEVAAIEAAAKAGKAALVAVSREKYATDLTGHSLGTKRISALDLPDVVFNVPKNVSWDNDMLAAIEGEVDSRGLPLWSYMDVKRTVSETAYEKLPADVKEKFAAARTVKPGAMTVKFEPAKGAN